MVKNSVLSGKTALFSGDSISYGSSDGIGGRAWAGRIAEGYGLLADNASMSGWSLSTIRTGRMIDQLYNAPDKAYDYVVLHGGVNDAWGDGTLYAPVGEITDTYDPACFDVTTYAGALEELFFFAYQKYPAARVGYIINFATPEAASIGHLGDMESYYAEGMKICEKWGVHYLDLYHDDHVNNTVMEVRTNRYMSDAVHPNAAGYDRLYSIIGDWMETLTENQKPSLETDTTKAYTMPFDCCGDMAAWQGRYDTDLAAVKTPEGEPAVLLKGKDPMGHHVNGFTWIGAMAEHTLPGGLDLSDEELLSFSFYLSHPLYGKAGQLQLTLITQGEEGCNFYFGIDAHHAGWHKITFSLKDERLQTNGADLADIRKIRFTWFNHNACMEQLDVAVGDITARKTAR